MENTQKKGNVLLALLLSLLAALAGSVIFGIVYGIGYYIYFLAIAEIVLAVGAFIKFMKKANGKIIAFAVLWGVLWTFIFNIVAVVICESIWVSKELGCSFFDSYKVVIDLWKNNLDVQAYMNRRVVEIAAMILIGGAVYGISTLIANKKAKNAIMAASNTSQSLNQIENKRLTLASKPSNISEQIITKSKEVYIASFNDCKDAYIKFEESHNEIELNKNKSLVKEKHLKDIDENIREHLIVIIDKFLAKENLSQIDRTVNLALLKMLHN